MTQNQSEALDSPTMSFSDVVQLIRKENDFKLSYVEASKILDVAIYPQVHEAELALLNRIEEKIQKKEDRPENYPEQWYRGFNYAQDEIKQILQKEREKL